MKIIDLRSDTVTMPTAAMRQAMAAAEVGDDVFGEDPSLVRLQERCAELLGKEAALFFPSGTMANQAALRLLTRPGDVVLGARDCHILRYEVGAAAALSGLQIMSLGENGSFGGDELKAALHPDEMHHAPTRVVAVENTHNVSGGRIFPEERLAELTAVAREAGLSMHLDGARLFNAAVASKSDPVDLAAPFDTVSMCLSKGLGAPVGSVVATSAGAIPDLLRIRKMLGGGMRQAGILAAAGLHALEHHVERLADDHANARRLAAGLDELGCEVPSLPETNIVAFRPEDPERFSKQMRARGVWVGAMGRGRFRAVTHLGVSRADVDEALERLADRHA